MENNIDLEKIKKNLGKNSKEMKNVSEKLGIQSQKKVKKRCKRKKKPRRKIAKTYGKNK